MAIIRFTTPTIFFTFNQIDITDITVAYLTIEQNGRVVIEKDITTATIVNTETDKYISWKLAQTDTSKLSAGSKSKIYCDWKTTDGTRGRSYEVVEQIDDTGKQEVI